MAEEKDRMSEYYRLLSEGHDRRTAYILTDKNPLATYERLEKKKEEREKKSKEE